VCVSAVQEGPDQCNEAARLGAAQPGRVPADCGHLEAGVGARRASPCQRGGSAACCQAVRGVTSVCWTVKTILLCS